VGLSTSRARTWHEGVLLATWPNRSSGQTWLLHAAFRSARTFGGFQVDPCPRCVAYPMSGP